jgi:polyisoprenoid-binding protein YceI
MLKKLSAVVLFGLMAFVAVVGSAALKPAAQPSAPIAAIPIQQSEAVAGAADPASNAVFVIKPGASTARFTIDEILRGSPNRVVGTTDQVTGQIAFDPSAPSNAQVGTIVVNARGLATDDAQRNRMIANFILSTGDYEYVSFRPTSLVGLPPTAAVDTPYMFEIQGELTIKDATRPATFSATVTPVSATELRGSATSTIRYGDWGISVPSVPSVAGLGDTVQLSLDFVATTAA